MIPKTSFSMRANLKSLTPFILKKWDEMNLMKDIFTYDPARKTYTILGGPPYANGALHTGHRLNFILKSSILRYLYCKGYNIRHKVGFDCHGFPISTKVNTSHPSKNASWENKVDHRERCKELANNNVKKQIEELKRLGILHENESYFKTMNWTSNIYELFSNILDHVYLNYRPMPWSISLGSTIPQSEIIYKEKESTSVYVALKIFNISNAYLIIWTTTAWTLIDNTAVAYHDNIEYSWIHHEEKKYLVSSTRAQALIHIFQWENTTITKANKINWKEMSCEHPIIDNQTIRLYFGKHVNDESGTGLVHTAPSHGPEDFELYQKYKHNGFIKISESVNDYGYYKQIGSKLDGKHIFNDLDSILESLGKKLIFSQVITHSYPYIDRTQEPLIYRSTLQVFANLKTVNTDDISDRMITFPENFGNYLSYYIKQREEWCLSRNHLWGVPIALFYDNNGVVYKSKKLQYIIQKKMILHPDIFLHESLARDFIKKNYKNMDNYQYYTGVLDVWFDSATVSHQASKDQQIKNSHLIMFEGIDQVRGWFQSSYLLANLSSQYRSTDTIITHCFVVDENRKKLSKSKGNAQVVEELIKNVGLEILYLLVLSSNYHKEIAFSKKLLENVSKDYRKMRNILRYCVSICETYEKNTHNPSYLMKLKGKLETQFLEKFHKMQIKYFIYLEKYHFHKSFKELICFIREFSSIYVESSKKQLYSEEDNMEIISLIRYILFHTIKLSTIFIPITCEEIYSYIKENIIILPFKQKSVHLIRYEDWNEKISIVSEK